MSPKEHLIERLIALCDANGGPYNVAKLAGISTEGVSQIIQRKPLLSGAPRGVGPHVQHKLDTAFPGWAGLANAPMNSRRWPLELITREQLESLSPVQRGVIEGAIMDAFAKLQTATTAPAVEVDDNSQPHCLVKMPSRRREDNIRMGSRYIGRDKDRPKAAPAKKSSKS